MEHIHPNVGLSPPYITIAPLTLPATPTLPLPHFGFLFFLFFFLFFFIFVFFVFWVSGSLGLQPCLHPAQCIDFPPSPPPKASGNPKNKKNEENKKNKKNKKKQKAGNGLESMDMNKNLPKMYENHCFLTFLFVFNALREYGRMA